MNAALSKTTLHLEGMHCGSCVTAVSSALPRLPTVHVEQAGYRVAAGNGREI